MRDSIQVVSTDGYETFHDEFDDLEHALEYQQEIEPGAAHSKVLVKTADEAVADRLRGILCLNGVNAVVVANGPSLSVFHPLRGSYPYNRALYLAEEFASRNGVMVAVLPVDAETFDRMEPFQVGDDELGDWMAAAADHKREQPCGYE